MVYSDLSFVQRLYCERITSFINYLHPNISMHILHIFCGVDKENVFNY